MLAGRLGQEYIFDGGIKMTRGELLEVLTVEELAAFGLGMQQDKPASSLFGDAVNDSCEDDLANC